MKIVSSFAIFLLFAALAVALPSYLEIQLAIVVIGALVVVLSMVD